MRAAILAVQHRRERARIVPGVASGQITRAAGSESVLRRRAHLHLDAPGAHIEQRERTCGRGLIPPERAVHDEGALHGQTLERVGDEPRDLHTERAHQMQRGLRGIDQGAEDVEHGAHAERGANRGDRPGGRMVVRRKQESEAGGLETGQRGRRIGRNRQPQGFEHVRAAAAARDRAVAVLDDRHAAGGGQERGAGGDVEASGGITAGADDVEGAQARGQLGPVRQAAHRLREAPHFIGHQALGRERREQRPRHRGRQLRVGQVSEQLLGLRLRQVAALEELLQQLTGQRHGLLRAWLARRARRRCT